MRYSLDQSMLLMTCGLLAFHFTRHSNTSRIVHCMCLSFMIDVSNCLLTADVITSIGTFRGNDS